jgi:hypothetical protein
MASQQEDLHSLGLCLFKLIWIRQVPGEIRLLLREKLLYHEGV